MDRQTVWKQVTQQDRGAVDPARNDPPASSVHSQQNLSCRLGRRQDGSTDQSAALHYWPRRRLKEHGGCHPAGTGEGQSYGGLAALRLYRAHQLMEPGLGCGVGGVSRGREESPQTSHHEHGALAFLIQSCEEPLNQGGLLNDVALQQRGVLVGVQRGEGTVGIARGGEGYDSKRSVFTCGQERVDGVARTEVKSEALYGASVLAADGTAESIQTSLIASHQKEVVTSLRERVGEGSPKTAGGTRDEGQRTAHVMSSCERLSDRENA